MIKSMTGYGRACELIDGMNITVELKSVNSRYLEFSSRVYKNYSFLEDKLKTYVRQLGFCSYYANSIRLLTKRITAVFWHTR